MIKKICLISAFNLYESKRYFILRLRESLNRLGIETMIMDPDSRIVTPASFEAVLAFDPDITFSFNSCIPDKKGRYIWDILQIPHLYALVDPLFYSISLASHPLVFFSSVDRDDCSIMEKNGVDRVFFWPHGVENNPPGEEVSGEREFDVVFLGSCTDFRGLEKKWRDVLCPLEQNLLHGAVDHLLSPERCSLINALMMSAKESSLDLRKVDLNRLLCFLDDYTRGKDRYELIRAIKKSQVHIFGEPSWNNPDQEVSWASYFKDQPNVILHPSVTYEESFRVLRKAKVCLNSTPFFSHGSHERILNALMTGAVPLTSYNGFVEEFFSPGKDLAVYRLGSWAEAAETVQELVSNEQLRASIAEFGKQNVLLHHTWDHRAKELVDSASLILKAFYN